jgi:hypothetical protein
MIHIWGFIVTLRTQRHDVRYIIRSTELLRHNVTLLKLAFAPTSPTPFMGFSLIDSEV